MGCVAGSYGRNGSVFHVKCDRNREFFKRELGSECGAPRTVDWVDSFLEKSDKCFIYIYIYIFSTMMEVRRRRMRSQDAKSSAHMENDSNMSINQSRDQRDEVSYFETWRNFSEQRI